MSKYDVNLSATALNDLENLLFFYFERSNDWDFVEKLENRIFDKIKTLDFMPQRCKKFAKHSEIYVMPFVNLPIQVYFAIDEAKKSVNVIHIRHSKENPQTILTLLN